MCSGAGVLCGCGCVSLFGLGGDTVGCGCCGIGGVVMISRNLLMASSVVGGVGSSCLIVRSKFLVASTILSVGVIVGICWLWCLYVTVSVTLTAPVCFIATCTQ